MLPISEWSISNEVVHNFEHKSGQWWMKMTDYNKKVADIISGQKIFKNFQ